MILRKEDIIRALRQNQEQLRKLGVERIGLFGSFVRGDQRPDSDVDVLVQFMPNMKSFDRFMQLSFLLEEILQHRTELVTIESLSPHVGPHILREVEYVSLAA